MVMKKIFSKIIVALALVAGPLALTGCDNEDNWVEEQVVIKGDGVANHELTIEIGSQLQLRAVKDFVVHGTGLEWITSDPSVVSISQNGLIQAVGLGDAIITVRTTGAEISDEGRIVVHVVNVSVGLVDDQVDQSEAE